MGSPAATGSGAACAACPLLLAGGIALAAHAGAVGLIVAALSLTRLTHAAVGRTAHPARRRADGCTRARRTGGGAHRRTQRRTAQRAEGGAHAHALGRVCSGAVA